MKKVCFLGTMYSRITKCYCFSIKWIYLKDFIISLPYGTVWLMLVYCFVSTLYSRNTKIFFFIIKLNYLKDLIASLPYDTVMADASLLFCKYNCIKEFKNLIFFLQNWIIWRILLPACHIVLSWLMLAFIVL